MTASDRDPHADLLVTASGAAVVEVTGPDRIEYLDAVTTQQLAGQPAGTVLGALVLDGKGIPLATLWALVDDERVLLVGDPVSVDHVVRVVAARTFLAQVTFRALPDLDVAEVGAAPDVDIAGRLTAAFGIEPQVGAWTGFGAAIVARHPFGLLVLGLTAEDVAERIDGAVANPADVAAVAGLPRFGHEVVAGRLPEEYGLLATHVHLGKGCYPGQEPIAHMWMLGRPRRRLATLRLPADWTGDPGVDGVEVTTVATVADNGGRVPALGFVAPDTEPGTDLADVVEVTGVVDDGLDVVGWTPAQTRRRDRDGRPDLPRRAP